MKFAGWVTWIGHELGLFRVWVGLGPNNIYSKKNKIKCQVL